MNTRTKTIDTDLIKQSIDLREYAATYTTLRRESSNELAGPCPKCGGDDRFHARPESFFCRQCYPLGNGLPHDIFAFVGWMNNCDFKEAAAILTNSPLPASPATRRQPTTKRPTEQTQGWLRSAETDEQAAYRRLFDDSDEEAEAGRVYLKKRGIEPHTWQAFRLGYEPIVAIPGTHDKQHAPAISMPWYKGGKIRGVRYRFLEKHSDHKQTALAGSIFGGAFYGGQALNTGIAKLSTLLICEGELNACAIWQATQDSHLDILSLGSESASITQAMIDVAAKYATVIVWMDKTEKAIAAAKKLGNAYAMQSLDGRDANDELLTGVLGGLVAAQRFQAAKNAHEQERLLWDLVDAAKLWGGVDKPTKQVMIRIAKLLGKSIPLVEVGPDTWRIVEPQYAAPAALSTDRQPLPVELWRQGIVEYPMAWRIWNELRETYHVVMGRNEEGYYVQAVTA